MIQHQQTPTVAEKQEYVLSYAYVWCIAFFWLDAAKTKGRDKWRSLWVQPGDQKKYKISLHNSTITIM